MGVIVGQKVPYTDLDPEAPAGEDVLEWYTERADKLIATLASSDLDAPTKSPFGERPVRFWFRRQAQEVAVHRWDIGHAYRGWDVDPSTRHWRQTGSASGRRFSRPGASGAMAAPRKSYGECEYS